MPIEICGFLETKAKGQTLQAEAVAVRWYQTQQEEAVVVRWYQTQQEEAVVVLAVGSVLLRTHGLPSQITDL